MTPMGQTRRLNTKFLRYKKKTRLGGLAFSVRTLPHGSGVQSCRARMSKKLGKKLGSPINSTRYSKKQNDEDIQVKDEGQKGPATSVPVSGGTESVRHSGCDDHLTINPSSTNDNDGPMVPRAHFEQLPLATESAGPPFDSPAPDEPSFPVIDLPRWEDVVRSISTSFPGDSPLSGYSLDNGCLDLSTNTTHNGVSRQNSRFEQRSVLNHASGGGFRDNGEECDSTLPSMPSQPRAGSRWLSSTTSSVVYPERSEAGYLDVDNFLGLPRCNAYRTDADQPEALSSSKPMPEMFLTVATTSIELSPIVGALRPDLTLSLVEIVLAPSRLCLACPTRLFSLDVCCYEPVHDTEWPLCKGHQRHASPGHNSPQVDTVFSCSFRAGVMSC